MRIILNLKKFLGWGRISKHLLLVRLSLANGMSFPEFLTSRIVVIRFVTEIGLIGIIILNIQVNNKLSDK